MAKRPARKKGSKAGKASSRLVALSIEEVARALSAAGGEKITAEQVRVLAERGSLIRADGTVSLIEFAAFLTQEYHGR